MNSSNKANLFVIGAAKCGTTALHDLLNQHSKIFMSYVKEPHYFADAISKVKAAYNIPKKGEVYHFKIIQDRKVYDSLFDYDDARIALYRGESSPSYLADNNAAEKILGYNPNAKFIVIVRDPIDRVISHYQMDLNGGEQRERNIIKAIEKDLNRHPKGWGYSHMYLELGEYDKQIENYISVVGRDNIVVVQNEELRNHAQQIFNKICNFLNIHEMNVKETIKNSAKVPRFIGIRTVARSPLIRSVYNKIPIQIKDAIGKLVFKKGYTINISEEELAYLVNHYKPTLKYLQDKFNIDYLTKYGLQRNSFLK